MYLDASAIQLFYHISECGLMILELRNNSCNALNRHGKKELNLLS